MNIDDVEKMADFSRPGMKKKILRDFQLLEISGVDRSAQPTARAVIMKRHEPDEIRKAFAALQAELDAVTESAQKLAYDVDKRAFDDALDGLVLKQETPFRDQLDAMAEEYADKTGRSMADAYDYLAKTEPALFHKAVCEGH